MGPPAPLTTRAGPAMIDQTADKVGRGIRPAPLTRTRRRGRFWRLLAWLLVVLALLAGLAWIIYPRQAAQQQPPGGGRFSSTRPMPVAVAAAEKAHVPPTLNAL